MKGVMFKSEVTAGPWTLDLAAGTASNGDIKITILEDGDRTFKVEYRKGMPEQGSYRLAAEVLAAFECAGVRVLGQCGPSPSVGEKANEAVPPGETTNRLRAADHLVKR